MKKLLLLECLLLILIACSCNERQRKLSYWTGKFSKKEAINIAQEELSKCCVNAGCSLAKFESPIIDSSGEIAPWVFTYESKQPPYHSISIIISKDGRTECHHSKNDEDK